MRNISKIKTLAIAKTLPLSLYILATVFATLVLSHQQLIVGTLVNLMLLTGATNLSKNKLISLAIFPSILAVFQGLIFGKFTVFLLFFLPFIWISNFVYMNVFKNTNGNIIYRLLMSSLGKTAILFLIANIFTQINLVPKIFLTSMGMMQLITSLLGGGAFLLVNKLENNNG